MGRQLDNWLESFIEYTSEVESPEMYLRWVGVSIIASALKRKVKLNWGYFDIYPNMFIVLVGSSGIRKGTAMRPGMSILEEAGLYVASDAITLEALIRQLQESTTTDFDKEGNPIIHSSISIFSEELTVFLKQHDNDRIAILNDWFDCKNRWRYTTKHQGEDDIIGVWVNLIGATTPELLQTSLPSDAIGGGFTSRILFVYEDSKGKINPLPFLTKEKVELRAKLVDDIQHIAMLAGEVKVTEKFLEIYSDWYIQNETKPPFSEPFLAGYINRRPIHLLKTCIIHSAAKSDDLILREEDFEDSLKLLERTERKLRYVFRGIGKSRVADVTANIMTTIASVKQISFADLMQMYYNDVNKDEMVKIIATLEAMRYCTITRTAPGDLHIQYNESGARKPSLEDIKNSLNQLTGGES